MVKNVNYNQGDEIIEVIIRDGSGAKLQIWRNNIIDSKANGRLLSLLIRKWGMNFDNTKEFTNIESEFLKF